MTLHLSVIDASTGRFRYASAGKPASEIVTAIANQLGPFAATSAPLMM